MKTASFINYPVGLPGWKVAARLGMHMKLRVDIHHDADTNSYWADSPDLDGLVVAAPTLDELRFEVRSAAEALLELAVHSRKLHTSPVLRFRDEDLQTA